MPYHDNDEKIRKKELLKRYFADKYSLNLPEMQDTGDVKRYLDIQKKMKDPPAPVNIPEDYLQQYLYRRLQSEEQNLPIAIREQRREAQLSESLHDKNSLLAALAQSGAQIGTFQGKAQSAQPVVDLAKNLNIGEQQRLKAQQDINEMEAQREGRAIGAAGMLEGNRAMANRMLTGLEYKNIADQKAAEEIARELAAKENLSSAQLMQKATEADLNRKLKEKELAGKAEIEKAKLKAYLEAKAGQKPGVGKEAKPKYKQVQLEDGIYWVNENDPTDKVKIGEGVKKPTKEIGSQAKGQKLPPNQIRAFGEGRDAVINLLNVQKQLKQHTEKTGPFMGRITGLNPYDTEAQVLRSDIKATAQMIGKYMEGGVLRAEDIPKYEQMLPQMSDTPEVAEGKVQNVLRMMRGKSERDINALEEQGYDTSGLSIEGNFVSSPKPASKGKIVRKQYNEKLNKTRIFYEGQTEPEVLDGRQ